MKILYIYILLSYTILNAASTRLEWSIDTSQFLSDMNGIPLSAGGGSEGDGSLLEIGYYSSATNVNPFSGTWITLFSESIGDKAINIDGQFSLSSVIFDTDTSIVQPSVGTTLSIRFFDSSTIAESTYFNTVSNTSGSWDWVLLSDPQSVINLEITKDASVWEGGTPSAFRTTIQVPEPSSLLLLSFSMLALFSRIRHSKI